MAATFYHQPTKRWLTSMGRDAKAGDVVELSSGSFAYSTPRGAFGFRSCQFTRYTLAEPVAHDDRYGEPLFDLSECDPRCPLDNSPQHLPMQEWLWSFRGQGECVEAIAAFARGFGLELRRAA